RMVAFGDDIGENLTTLGASWKSRGGRQLIAWSLESPDAIHTARHEAIHALKEMGLFTDKEWRTLEEAATDDRPDANGKPTRPSWIDRYEIDRRYDGSPWHLQIEEAIAERFADWRREKPILPKALRPIFSRIDLALRGISAGIRKLLGKDATAADIFRLIDLGEVGRREPGTPEKPSAAKRQQLDLFGTPAAPPDKLVHLGSLLASGVPITSPEVMRLTRELADHAKAGQIDLSNQMSESAQRVHAGAEQRYREPWLATGEYGDGRHPGVRSAKPGARIVGQSAGARAFVRLARMVQDGKIPARLVHDAAREAHDSAQHGGKVSFQRVERPEEGEPARKPKPRGMINKALGEGVDALGNRAVVAAVKAAPDPLVDLVDAARMNINPMAVGSDRAKASAKDFANAMREVRWEWGRVDKWLEDHFTPGERERMWKAADEESVLRQQGVEPGPNQGLNALPDREREAVVELQKRATDAFVRAQALGMTKSEGLPSYVPRMVIEMTRDGARRVGAGAPTTAKTGRNLSTTTSQLKQRKHLTTEETEEAARAKFGGDATVVKDIRTLALATGRLEQAIAGRTLVQKIKAFSAEAGETTVAEGVNPDPDAFFTIDHPALRSWGPKLITDQETGKTVAAKDQNGQTVFEARPLYIAKEFEGPLKAVLQTPTGKIYDGLMTLKGKAMSVIMYSPLMHNAVIWGKAIPAAPAKVLTGMIYVQGHKAKTNPETMREALRAGLDPIGRRYFNQDITAIAEPPQIAPGRSWTAQFLAAVPGLFSKSAGDSVKRAVDKAGDVWHNT
ncbi:MAG TPA: hypothetical protein VFE03_12430, partial [Caulobacteraceae bacterium]|nr:hypothetical protein [Caulobacteraceae bacterium]